MKSFLLLFLIIFTIGCSKKSSNSTTIIAPQYTGLYSYTPPALSVGDGKVYVSADEITQCLDSNGNEVELTLCPDSSSAPLKEFLSPAGTITVPVDGAVGGSVEVTLTEGQSYNNLDQEDKDDIIASFLTDCDVGRVRVQHRCVVEGYELHFYPYPSTTKTEVCSGSETVSRTSDCRYNITNEIVDSSNCVALTDPSPDMTYQSPAGTKQTDQSGNTLEETCDLGDTNWVITNLICNNPDQHQTGVAPTFSCEDDVFTPSDFTFPENTLEVGDGTQVIDATGFNTCTNTTKSIPATLAKCSMPAIPPTVSYDSPAGTRDVVSGDNTIQESCTEGDNVCIQLDITCGNANQHKEGEGSLATCEDDTFVAGDFSFPANTMTVGQGSQIVDATSFNTCTNTTKSTVIDNSFCSLPATLPTETQLSPAGDLEVPVSGAVDGIATVTLEEGVDWAGTPPEDKEALIAGVLVCEEGTIKLGSKCVSGIKQIASGFGHTCAIMGDDTVKCVGFNYYGQLGLADGYRGATQVWTPTTVTSFGKVKKIAVAYYQTCYIGEDDVARCVGLNENAQLGTSYNNGNDQGYYESREVNAMGTVKDIVLGDKHMCGIVKDDLVPANDNTVKCYGDNTLGQLSSDAVAGTTANFIPVTVTTLGKVQQLGLGTGFTCGLLENGTVKCFGNNRFGALGNTTNIGVATANPVGVVVSGYTAIKKISVGYGHICAQTFDDLLKCHGLNWQGALGSATNFGTLSGVPTPQDSYTSPIKDFSSTGYGHTCIVTKDDEEPTNDGILKCVGNSSQYQLGANTTTNTSTWYTVSTPEKVKDVSLGLYNTCFRDINDEPYCFGGNTSGQLGAGDGWPGPTIRDFLYK